MQPYKSAVSLLALFLLSSTSFSAAAGTDKAAFYADAHPLRGTWALVPPPADSSAAAAADLAAVRRIEQTRTSAQVAQAIADDREQDIFIFAPVVGESFTAANFPLAAELSAHLHSDEGAVSDPLKLAFARPRPYQADHTLHPVCRVTEVHNSYPSGHALGGYLFALALAEMLPEKREAILERADGYAHSRLVCGVHYPSDLRASRGLAFEVFGNMLANPRFQKDLEAARVELRTRLNLAPIR